mmetsp:Transcript_115058/g.199641  ORF Transcript_115058/g.199641 Transcript_115058/m.199641 type:complete len:535 (+) Transcript_115058:89-1693(+)
MQPAKLVVCFTLLQLCCAVVNLAPRSAHEHGVKQHHIRLLRMARSHRACFTKAPAVRHGLTLLGQSIQKKASSAQNPGAGMGPVVPFETVFKDGYTWTSCVKDYMFNFGDKHYDNKYEYKEGKVSNTSIVHYSAVVPKIDQELMTPQVCFNFCRTVPDMTVFGIVNGRDCYCAPFFKAMASDDEVCSAPCEGEKSQICGSADKSSIFSMHACDDTDKYLFKVTDETDFLEDTLDHYIDWVEGYHRDMGGYATSWQAAFGQAGDPGAADLMQKAIVFAADMDTIATKLEKIEDDADDVEDDAEDWAEFENGDGFTGMAPDFKEFDNAKKADEYAAKMKSMWPNLKSAIKEAKVHKQSLSPIYELAEGSKPEAQYYPVMYFVDKEFENAPSTCTGKTTGNPMVDLTLSTCAMACDAAIPCKAFSYFATHGGNNSLCFLFEELESAQYYTKDCTSLIQRPRAFLQARNVQAKATGQVSCMAKLSKFVGTSLAPDPSGKMDGRLKKVTKADRCFAWPDAIEPDVDGELVDCEGEPHEC